MTGIGGIQPHTGLKLGTLGTYIYNVMFILSATSIVIGRLGIVISANLPFKVETVMSMTKGR